MVALALKDVYKQFGATKIIRGVTLEIERGENHAIIGPNGAGKSTLFHLISGRHQVTSGTIKLNGREIQNQRPYDINRQGLARSFQVTNIFSHLSVFENVRCALLWSSGYRYSFWHLLGREKHLNEQAMTVLEKIGLDGRADTPAGELAYAQQRALELGITVASGAEVILLDEPIAGMSHNEARNAVRLIREVTLGKTLVMVEHDMNVVFDIADRISVLVYGEIIATGSPEQIHADPGVQEAYLGEVAAGA